jgi:integrase/recombinase XerD
MRFTVAIDSFADDLAAQGRINSPRTDRDYRYVLEAHSDDVQNRDPRYTDRGDVKKTLRRWAHPNSQAKNHAILKSFYDWTMEEGLRTDNPARQVRRAKRRKPIKYRLTRPETLALLDAADTTREKRLIHVGVCAGFRAETLRGLQGKHFNRRPGYIWVEDKIAKGQREHWMPVLPDLEPVTAEIAEHVADDEYMLPAQRFRDPGVNRSRRDYATKPASPQAIWRLVKTVGARAGIKASISPHTMRHAFADHIVRSLGIWMAKALLNHATVGTTEAYLGDPTLDELAAAVQGFSFAAAANPAGMGLKAPTGIEPVQSSAQLVERFLVHDQPIDFAALGRERVRGRDG